MWSCRANVPTQSQTDSILPDTAAKASTIFLVRSICSKSNHVKNQKCGKYYSVGKVYSFNNIPWINRGLAFLRTMNWITQLQICFLRLRWNCTAVSLYLSSLVSWFLASCINRTLGPSRHQQGALLTESLQFAATPNLVSLLRSLKAT